MSPTSESSTSSHVYINSLSSTVSIPTKKSAYRYTFQQIDPKILFNIFDFCGFSFTLSFTCRRWYRINTHELLSYFIFKIREERDPYIESIVKNALIELSLKMKNISDYASSHCITEAYMRPYIQLYTGRFISRIIERKLPSNILPMYGLQQTVSQVLSREIHDLLECDPFADQEQLQKTIAQKLTTIFTEFLTPITKETYHFTSSDHRVKYLLKIAEKSKNLVHQDKLNIIRKSIIQLAEPFPEILELLNGWQVDQAHPFYSSYLNQVWRCIESYNLDLLFEGVVKTIPSDSSITNFLNNLKYLTIIEKANQIRGWLKDNATLINRIIVLDLQKTKMNKIPKEIYLLKELRILKISYSIDLFYISNLVSYKPPKLQKIVNSNGSIIDFTSLHTSPNLIL